MDIETKQRLGTKVFTKVEKLNILDVDAFKLTFWDYVELVTKSILLVLPVALLLSLIW